MTPAQQHHALELVENIRDLLDRLDTETEYLQQHQQVTLKPVFDIALLISIETDNLAQLLTGPNQQPDLLATLTEAAA